MADTNNQALPVFKRRGAPKRETPPEIATVLDIVASGAGHLIPGPLDRAAKARWRTNLKNHAARRGIALTMPITQDDGLWVQIRQKEDE